MLELNPTTVTITGLDGDVNEALFKKISVMLRQEGLRATVRIEVAEKPHHYDSKELGRYAQHDDPSLIALNGSYTVDELDGISFRLRGGR